jgi:hypothetical protein
VTRPTFAVVGAARSGTTAVIEALRGRPDVFVTNPKEPHFYAFAGTDVAFRGPGDGDTINRVAVTDRQRFLGLFDAASDQHVARGDGSVSTLYYYEHSIEAVRSTNPQMRIVVILRDPVERAYSSFQYLRSRGYEPLSDFSDALAAEQSRRKEGWHHLWHYAAMSQYAAQVEAFLDAFGRDQVGVWLYEDFASDPGAVLGSIFQFVGSTAPLDVADVHRVNVSGVPHSPMLHRAQLAAARQPLLRATVKRLVPFAVRERIRTAQLKPTSVPPDARAMLAERLGSDVADLASMLRQPLDAWATSFSEDGP